MKEGLLWLDVDPKRSLRDKIIRADASYRRKFGVVPDLCFCNAGQLEKPMTVGRLRVLPAQNVLRHHFLVGVERKKEDGNSETEHFTTGSGGGNRH